MSLKSKVPAVTKILPQIQKHLKKCRLCPRNCRVNRLKNNKGYCAQDKTLKIHTSFLHRGEEPPISGKNGSGTVFFSGCNLKCSYCQNYKFSQLKSGKKFKPEQLTQTLLGLEKNKAENINLVTPTHFLPQILSALKGAWEKGLNIPIVYNSSGYEKESIIKLLSPLVDCWLLDFKYFSSKTAQKYSNSPKYPGLIKKACLYLYRQIKSQNKLNTGSIPPLIIRHLVLPGHIQESKKILAWLKKNLPETPLSLMSQYQPYFQAKKHPAINRPLRFNEYRQIKNIAEKLILRGWLQEFKPQEDLAGVYFPEKNPGS